MEMAIKYTRSMHALLDWFDDQPCSCATVARIANGTGYTPGTVRNNLQKLAAADCAENLYESTGEYRLIEDPRQNDD